MQQAATANLNVLAATTQRINLVDPPGATLQLERETPKEKTKGREKFTDEWDELNDYSDGDILDDEEVDGNTSPVKKLKVEEYPVFNQPIKPEPRDGDHVMREANPEAPIHARYAPNDATVEAHHKQMRIEEELVRHQMELIERAQQIEAKLRSRGEATKKALPKSVSVRSSDIRVAPVAAQEDLAFARIIFKQIQNSEFMRAIVNNIGPVLSNHPMYKLFAPRGHAIVVFDRRHLAQFRRICKDIKSLDAIDFAPCPGGKDYLQVLFNGLPDGVTFDELKSTIQEVTGGRVLGGYLDPEGRFFYGDLESLTQIQRLVEAGTIEVRGAHVAVKVVEDGTPDSSKLHVVGTPTDTNVSDRHILEMFRRLGTGCEFARFDSHHNVVTNIRSGFGQLVCTSDIHARRFLDFANRVAYELDGVEIEVTPFQKRDKSGSNRKTRTSSGRPQLKALTNAN